MDYKKCRRDADAPREGKLLPVPADIFLEVLQQYNEIRCGAQKPRRGTGTLID